MCNATKVAVSAGAFPIGPAMRLAVVKTKVLPLGVYGAESTPVAKSHLQRLRSSIATFLLRKASRN
eukprot:5022732-Alexandrium_andersonii.AAC.1